MRELSHPAGLCATCARARVTGNRRGSRFWLCTRSQSDPRYPRYPRLPVLRCPGWEAGAPSEGSEDDDEREAAGKAVPREPEPEEET